MYIYIYDLQPVSSAYVSIQRNGSNKNTHAMYLTLYPNTQARTITALLSLRSGAGPARAPELSRKPQPPIRRCDSSSS